MSFNLYPAILTESTNVAQNQIMSIASVPKIRTVQIDVIDGVYADNLTITPSDLPEIDFGELSCDLHFMTEEPLDFLHETIDHRDEIPVRAILGQIEKMSHQVDFLQSVKNQGWQAGLSLDLYTPIESIDDDSWQLLEIVQLMGIEAGFQGQSFNYTVIDKIKELHRISMRKNKNIELCVDGGITAALADVFLNELHTQNADTIVDSIVVGSSLWNSEDARQAAEMFL